MASKRKAGDASPSTSSRAVAVVPDVAELPESRDRRFKELYSKPPDFKELARCDPDFAAVYVHLAPSCHAVFAHLVL